VMATPTAAVAVAITGGHILAGLADGTVSAYLP